MTGKEAAWRRSGLLLAGLGGLLAGCVEPVETVHSQVMTADARNVILEGVRDPDAATRCHAVEALARTGGAAAGEALMEALKDDNAAVRFAAAMAVGDIAYTPAKARLAAMAKSDEADKRVFCAVAYALYRLQEDEHVGPLGTLLFDAEPEVRADAAMAMGKIGERSAVVPLTTRLADEQEPAVRLQIVEALASLGDKRSMGLLEAYTKTSYLDERLVAIAAVARLPTPQTRAVLRGLLGTKHPPRVRVAAAGGLARLGQVDEGGYRLCLQSIERPDAVLRQYYGRQQQVRATDIASLQQLAAQSLGWSRRAAAAQALRALLANRNGAVRIAAAMALLQIGGEAAATPPGRRRAGPEGRGPGTWGRSYE